MSDGTNDPVKLVDEVCEGFEFERTQAVDELLTGIDDDGGPVSRDVLEKMVRLAFNGGVMASISNRSAYRVACERLVAFAKTNPELRREGGE